MSKIEDISRLLPNIFKASSLYKNEFALRVLLEDSDCSPFSFYQSIRKAKNILMSMLYDDCIIYYIQVRKMDDNTDESLANQIEGAECLETIIRPYEKFEEDFEDFGCIYAEYTLYKVKITEKVIIDLLWNQIAITYGHAFTFEPYSHDEVYFIDPNNNWSFYPYDSRGIDILCKDLETYRETYKKLESYLFEHDIELMKKRLQY